jgi:hypothetical protein
MVVVIFPLSLLVQLQAQITLDLSLEQEELTSVVLEQLAQSTANTVLLCAKFVWNRRVLWGGGKHLTMDDS